ncbi:hypothetical protein BHE89_16770 [Shigella sp. FC1967]|uniref:hypothetical protein n=1 Tax=Shigella sp. FC1967 TaxID=1898041 RepID=UPI00086A779F|nr:hypothetical protein [Shigella sp. FC1967]OEJ07477.1 hypothetical protein BHE89_16770 [Shigella sp. FC1967]
MIKEKILVRAKLQQWEDVANIKFIEVSDEKDTDLKFGMYNNLSEIGNYRSHSVRGFAFHPNNIEKKYKIAESKIEKVEDYTFSGQVWINMSDMNIEYITKSTITPEQQIKSKLFLNLKADIIEYSIEEHDKYYILLKNK